MDNVDISSSDNDVRNVVFNNLQPVMASKSNVVYPCTDTSIPVEFDTHLPFTNHSQSIVDCPGSAAKPEVGEEVGVDCVSQSAKVPCVHSTKLGLQADSGNVVDCVSQSDNLHATGPDKLDFSDYSIRRSNVPKPIPQVYSQAFEFNPSPL